TPLITERCAAAVASAVRDDVAPALNPGRVHRRENSCSAVRRAQRWNFRRLRCLLVLKIACKTYANRTALMLLFPQRAVMARFGRFAVPSFTCRSTREVLVNHLCCLLYLCQFHSKY